MSGTKDSEQKLPKYISGMGWRDYKIKYLSAAGTRGRTRMALMGEFVGKMPAWTIMRTGQKIRTQTPDQDKMEKENYRAFADLVASMPSGELTYLVHESKTEEYPDGCAATAWKNLMSKIGKTSMDDRRRLKEFFESEQELSGRVNPSKYIDKLIIVKDELKEKYSYVRTDEDIIDQVIKVVNEDYSFLVEQIKSDRRRSCTMTLDEVKDAFNEKYLELKRKRRRKKGRRKKIDVSEDSSEDSDDEDERGLHGMTTRADGEGRRKGDGNQFGQAAMDNGEPGNTNKQHQQQQQRPYHPYMKQFKGYCNYCGKQGHKAIDCEDKKKDLGTQGGEGKWVRTRCPHCNKDTHPADRCFELEKNAHFRPPNWKSTRQQQQPAKGTQMWQGDGPANQNSPKACGYCASPKHADADCPMVKLKELQMSDEKMRRTKPGSYANAAMIGIMRGAMMGVHLSIWTR